MIPETLDELTEWIIKQKDTYGALAIHPFVDARSQVRLERLMFEDKRTRLVFAAAHYSPDTVLDRLINDHVSDSFNEQLHTRIVQHPNTSAKTLQRIYHQDCSEKLITMLAAHPNTPVAILEELDWHKSEKIRMALCGNSNLTLKLIKKILPISSLQEKKRLINHAQLDEESLKILWKEGDEYLRAEVVAHSNCPLDLINKAINSSHMLIRKRLASNPSIDESICHRLLQDHDARVRAAVIKNQEVVTDGFTDEELLSLCYDPSNQVRRNEAKRIELSLEVIQQLAEDNDIWVKRWLARNAHTPEKILGQLAKDSDHNVRRSVARNPACSKKLLMILAEDQSSWVRAGVALRGDIPRETLHVLAKEQDVNILSAVGRNPSTPPEILDEILLSENRDIRRSVILNSNAPAKTLEKLQDDPYPLNRIFLGNRMLCNKQTKWTLMNDPDPEVRFSSIRTYAKQISL